MFGQWPVFNSFTEHFDFKKFFLLATKLIHLELMQRVTFPNNFPNILSCKMSTISKATLEGKSIIDSNDATLSATIKNKQYTHYKIILQQISVDVCVILMY